MTTSTVVDPATVAKPGPKAPAVNGAVTKPGTGCKSKRKPPPVPAAAELRQRHAAFVADGGLELVNGRVHDVLVGDLPEDDVDFDRSKRSSVSWALTIGEGMLRFSQLRKRCNDLVGLQDELPLAIGRGWPYRILLSQNPDIRDLTRAVGIAEERVAAYRAQALADEADALAAEGLDSRWHELETRRSELWDAHEHLLRRDDRYKWVRIVSTKSRLTTDEKKLKVLADAIEDFVAFVRGLTESPRVRGGGRRGNEAARARGRERNKAILDARGKKV